MFDTMNNLSFVFNNRMDGIEIAESLLYKDLEKPFAQKFYQTAISDTFAYLSGQSDVNKRLNNAGFENNSMLFYEQNHKPNNCIIIDDGSVRNSISNGRGFSQPVIESVALPNNFSTSMTKNNNYDANLQNKLVQDMENSTTHFRPISANICEEFNDLDTNNKSNIISRDLFASFRNNDSFNGKNNEKGSSEYSRQPYYNINDQSNVVPTDINEHISNNSQCTIHEDSLFNGVFSINQNLLTTAFSGSDVSSCTSHNRPVSPNRRNITNENNHKDSSFFNGYNQLNLFNNPSLSRNEDNNSIGQSLESPHSNNNSAAIIPVKMPINSINESAPITSLPSSTMGTTITIPRGSYIFIPLSVQNFPGKEMQTNTLFQNTSITDLQPLTSDINGNNKYIFGCYPMISQLHEMKVPSKQLPPIVPPKQTYSQSTSIIITDPESTKPTPSILHSSQIPSTINTPGKQDKKKSESMEFNYYLNMIGDSHKMLIKEKNKISMDRNVLKDENWKNVINYTTRNNNNSINKLEKELNLLINSLFEINVLISKIEAMRGTFFVEPFYSILQSAAELIQSFHPGENFSQCPQRQHNATKQNEKDVEIQVDKLKLLFFNLQRIRAFLWASYTNFTLERERLLSYSLNKLKSWCETKKQIRQSLKLKESNVKSQMSSCNSSNADIINSYQNSMPNSLRQTMKIDRNAMTMQTQSYTIPVSQYHTIPNRMTTILQRFPGQILTNSPQYNYIQTSLSNYSHPTIINNNKFSIGSNCRLSYGSQQQLCTATPINTGHTNLPPRNFLIGPSSLMTPIIYQNNPRPVINNTSVNFMLYKTNTQMI